MPEALSAERITIIGMLLSVLWGGARGIWVWGWQYREAVRDRDEWKGLALRGTQMAQRAVTLANGMPQ